MIKKAVGLAAMAAIGVAISIGWPDVQRYFKIRHLSAQNSHPEMVPAEGRSAYPQRHADGAPDGTGDFDSAQRGGPARA